MITKPSILTDGEHLLPCGATFLVENGEPTSLLAANVTDRVHALDALNEVEERTGIWFDDEGYSRWEDDEGRETLGFPLVRLDQQPTHRFINGDESHLVQLGPDLDDDEGAAKGEPRMVALGRGSFTEDEDGDGWPPYLKDGVWFDSFTDEPMPHARVEPLATEVQA